MDHLERKREFTEGDLLSRCDAYEARYVRDTLKLYTWWVMTHESAPITITPLRTEALVVPVDACRMNVAQASSVAKLASAIFSKGVSWGLSLGAAYVVGERSNVVAEIGSDPYLAEQFFSGTERAPFVVDFPNSSPHENSKPLVKAMGQDVILGFMRQQLIDAWTAFEVLAVDLWIEAVNRRPMSLGEKAWTAKRQSDGKLEDAARGNDLGGAVMPIEILHDYDYDLSRSMGMILHRSRKFNFSRLKGIQHAYRVAFDDSFKNAIPDFANLSLLELVRNLLLHRAGLIDEAFIRMANGHELVAGCTSGKTLPLDGRTVGILVNSAFSACRSLIEFVDEWLATRPD